MNAVEFLEMAESLIDLFSDEEDVAILRDAIKFKREWLESPHPVTDPDEFYRHRGAWSVGWGCFHRQEMKLMRAANFIWYATMPTHEMSEAARGVVENFNRIRA